MKTELGTRANGLLVVKFDKVVVSKSGLMVRCMRDTGLTTRPTARDGLFTLTATSTTDTGKTIKHMDLEFIVILMEHAIKATGKKTSNMVKV